MNTDSRARVLGDRYELGPVIGQGGMGRVHRAHDRQLDREVAVKVLPGAEHGDPSRRFRFEREARATARVSHPNVVAVYDEGADGDELYFVMECLPGPQPRRRAGDRPVVCGPGAPDRARSPHWPGRGPPRRCPPSRHQAGERDADRVGRRQVGRLRHREDGGHERPHAGGMLIGTAPYLPPERLRGEPATQSGDLYAIGAVLYEALTGRHPFAGDTPVAIAHAMATTDPPRLASVRPDVDAGLAGTIDRSLSRDPALRFPSARSMAAGIEDEPTTAPETVLMTPAPTMELLPAPMSAPDVGPVPPHPSTASRRGAVLLAAAVAALVITFVVLSMLAARRPSPGSVSTSTIPPTTTTVVTATASTLSPPTSSPPPTTSTGRRRTTTAATGGASTAGDRGWPRAIPSGRRRAR